MTFEIIAHIGQDSFNEGAGSMQEFKKIFNDLYDNGYEKLTVYAFDNGKSKRVTYVRGKEKWDKMR